MQSQRTDGGGDCPTLRGVGETETNIGDIETKDWAKDSHDVTSGLNDPGQDGSATDVVTAQPQYSQSQSKRLCLLSPQIICAWKLTFMWFHCSRT